MTRPRKCWMPLLTLIVVIFSVCMKVSSKTVSPEPTQRIDLSGELYLRQIGDRAYVITNTFPWSANSMLVEMSDGTLVLAGMPYTPEATRLILDWVKRQYGQRKMIAIDIGYHVDNMGGNQALIEPGILVYGSDLTAKLILAHG